MVAVVALVAAAAGEGLWANAAGVWETQMIEIRVNSFSRIYALTVSPACANLAHLSFFVSFSSAQFVPPPPPSSSSLLRHRPDPLLPFHRSHPQDRR